MLEKMNKSMKLIIGFIIIIWCIYFVSLVIPVQQFGLIPRTVRGLFGIISSPFLHGSLNHLTGNTISLFVLAMILSFLEGDKTIARIVSMVLIGGALTWLFARSANHIGASGLIFAIWGYILLSAWYSKKPKYIWLSIFVIFFYGGMIFGVFPLRSGVSWEGHLFGLIAGIYLAWFYHKKTAQSRR